MHPGGARLRLGLETQTLCKVAVAVTLGELPSESQDPGAML